MDSIPEPPEPEEFASEPDEPREQETAPRLRSYRLPLSNAQIILIALIIVGGRLIIDFSQRIVEGQQKIAQQRQLEAEIEMLMEEQQNLLTAKAYYSSPAFIEAWAHNEGKMVRDGEILVIPLYGENGGTETGPLDTATVSPPEPLLPWQVWWTLFFDVPPPSTRSR
jgi:cell division protein FtsB